MTYGISRIFRSTDSGAPQYNGATLGSFKDMLKAVLINGYGSTAPLGWVKEFESGNVMVVRPTYGRLRPYVRIDDSVSSYGALVRVYTSMLDINNGTEPMPTLDINAYLVKTQTTNSTNVPWIIIGDDAGFYIMSKWLYPNYTNTNFYGNIWMLQYIGYFQAWDTRNIWNFSVFLGQVAGYLNTITYVLYSTGTNPAMNYGYSGSLRGCDFAKGPVVIGTKGIGPSYLGINQAPGFIDTTTNVRKANGTYVMHPVRITEYKSSTLVTVGTMPGLYDPMFKDIVNTSLTYANMPYDEFTDSNGDLHIYFTLQNYNNGDTASCPKVILKVGRGFRNVI